MHKDYIDAVLKEYHGKVNSNIISLNLSRLTPGNVKKECKAICQQRFRRADERVLIAFFEHAENATGYIQSIKRCDIDKFRPMINFVEGQSKDTDDKNIELLAWLIDFKDRPFNPKGIYGGEIQGAKVDEPQVGVDETPGLKSDPKPSPFTENNIDTKGTPKSRSMSKLLVAALIVSLFVVTVGMQSQVKPDTKYIISNYVRNEILPNERINNSIQSANMSSGQIDGFKPLSKQLKTSSSGIYGRCQAITRKKAQCLRNAQSGGFCWQHKK